MSRGGGIEHCPSVRSRVPVADKICDPIADRSFCPTILHEASVLTVRGEREHRKYSFTVCNFRVSIIGDTAIVYFLSMPNMQPSNVKYAATDAKYAAQLAWHALLALSSSHLRFDHVYIVEFQSALTSRSQSRKVMAE